MKVIIAALCCSFISAICASEYNSSLLESKADDAITSSSSTPSKSSRTEVIMWASLVITIMIKSMEGNDLEIFVSAILVSPKLLLTGTQYVSIIENKVMLPDYDYPQYTVCIHNTKANTVLNYIAIKGTTYFDRTNEGVLQFQKLALLKMQRSLKTVRLEDIKKTVDVNYIYGRNMEVFTYANNQAKNYNTGGSIRKIKFVEKCGGYAAIPEHDNNYQIFPGAPLIYKNFVVGVCDGWVFNENDRREEHEREKIYKFIFLYTV